MKRRNALQLLAIGTASPLAAQHAGHGPASSGKAIELQFFSREQHALVDCIAEMIIPADDRSGGAHEAEVAAFIDNLVANQDESAQQTWTKGLAAMNAEAQRRFQRDFAACTEGQRDQMVSELADKEEDPKSELERFFVQIKRQTISGYYTSKIGLLDELEYKGGVPIPEYVLCTHPKHTK